MSKPNTIPEESKEKLGEYNLEKNIQDLYSQDPFLCELVFEAKTLTSDLSEGTEEIERKRRNVDTDSFDLFNERVRNIIKMNSQSISSAEIVEKFETEIKDTYQNLNLLNLRIQSYRVLVDTVIQKKDAVIDPPSRGKGCYLDLRKKVLQIRALIKEKIKTDQIIADLKTSPALVQLVSNDLEDYLSVQKDIEERCAIQLKDAVIKTPRSTFAKLPQIIFGLQDGKSLTTISQQLKIQLSWVNAVADLIKETKQSAEIYAGEFKKFEAVIAKHKTTEKILDTLVDPTKSLVNKFLEFVARQSLSCNDLWKESHKRQKICTLLENNHSDDDILREILNDHYSMVMLSLNVTPQSKLSEIAAISKRWSSPVLIQHPLGISIYGFKQNAWSLTALDPKIIFLEFPQNQFPQDLKKDAISIDLYGEITRKNAHSFLDYMESKDISELEYTRADKIRSILRGDIELTINFINIDRDIRRANSQEFNGPIYHELRGLIKDIRKTTRGALQHQEGVQPDLKASTVDQPFHLTTPVITPPVSFPAPQLRAGPAPIFISPFLRQMGNTARESLENASAVWAIPLLESDVLEGRFNGMMRTPHRDVVAQFFAPCFRRVPSEEKQRTVLKKLFKRNKYASTIRELLFCEPHLKGHELGLEDLMSANPKPFLEQLQDYLNAGNDKETVKAFKFIMDYSPVFLTGYSDIYLTETGFFELMKLFDWLQQLSLKHQESAKILSPKAE